MGYVRNNKAKLTLIIFAAVIIGGYGFFFSSKQILSTPITKLDDVTQPGRAYAFSSERTYTLISASYSARQHKMEVLLDLKNESGDGINSYYYAQDVEGASEKATVTNEVYASQIITVLDIDGLPEFDEVYLLFAPQVAAFEDIKPKDTAMIVLNKYNVLPVDKIVEKTEPEFQVDRLAYLIEKHAKDKSQSEEKITSYANTATGLEEENRQLEADSIFLLPDEKLESDQHISQNKSRIADLLDQTGKENEALAHTEEALASAKLMVADLLSPLIEAKEAEKTASENTIKSIEANIEKLQSENVKLEADKKQGGLSSDDKKKNNAQTNENKDRIEALAKALAAEQETLADIDEALVRYQNTLASL
jgi:hypothetical protein